MDKCKDNPSAPTLKIRRILRNGPMYQGLHHDVDTCIHNLTSKSGHCRYLQLGSILGSFPSHSRILGEIIDQGFVSNQNCRQDVNNLEEQQEIYRDPLAFEEHFLIKFAIMVVVYSKMQEFEPSRHLFRMGSSWCKGKLETYFI